ncbi:putative membrane protein YeaQ/YmgE (transglycosylase-associated protein family) [Allocatelliglobosispora scoriae]|uniref:Putative membrane protein YeaQ/YmgE (Transglycosylase-associated protein family) n=1 Tax=Allocatelliglobosispora scoriae TaxID=643052 RepID=A0A841BPT3_9ACTN|nr:GlsB/YeaQ/YmgE family stress response membrane protein [Allocatelliglobosispora scoriae]MBB5868953.1 putative membrane protein YeaQ/YmgE (transglycosylase-associated protein family) [Allocatelliglobosispora scoriae]
MTATGILSAILIGIVIGTLGRLILPGRQSIGAVATVAVGVVAALLGTWASRALGWDDNVPGRFDWDWAGWHFGWSWVELGVQLVFAVIGIAIAAALTRTAIADDDAPKRRRRRRSNA